MSESKADASKKDIDDEFASSTTCHGIYHAYATTHTSVRVFWLLLVLGMLGVLISQVVLRIMAYLEYDTSTDIAEEFVSFLGFPAVTICSYNRYFLNASQKELEAIYVLNQLSSGSYAAYAKEHNVKYNLSALDALGKNFNVTEYSKKYGFSIEGKNMPECWFKSKRCHSSEFKEIITAMGRCYTFNEDESTQRIQNIPGAGHGLSIILEISEDLYTEQPIFGNVEAGVKLQIHPPYEEPDVETYGISIPTGQSALIEMRRSDHILMYEPWGVCDKSSESLKYFSKYTWNNCIYECYTDELIKNCGCRLYAQYWAAGHAPECTIQQMNDCTAAILVAIKQNYSAADCGCTIPCQFTEYGFTTSYAKFPNKPTVEYLQEMMNASRFEVGNALKFGIHFERMSYKVFTQSKKVDESGLLSDVGGQLGLWLGMSFLTIVEFVQYCIKRYSVKNESKVRVAN